MKKTGWSPRHFLRGKPSSSPAEPTGRFGPVSALVVTAAAYFGSQVAAGLALGLYLQLSGKDPKVFADELSSSNAIQFILLLLVQLAMLAVIYWFVRRQGITNSEIGLGRSPKKKDIGYAAICFVVYIFLLAVVSGVLQDILPRMNFEQRQQLPFESTNDPASLAIIFVALVIITPIVEEIMVRGFLYSGLRRKFKKITSALIASVLFGIAHLQLGSGVAPLYVAAVDTFMLSMVLVALREKTGSLWSGMIVHGLKNCLAFFSLFVFNIV